MTRRGDTNKAGGEGKCQRKAGHQSFSSLPDQHTHITQLRNQQWWWWWWSCSISGPVLKVEQSSATSVTFLKYYACNTMDFSFPLPHKGKNSSSRKNIVKRERWKKKEKEQERDMFNQALKSATPGAMNIPLAFPQKGARSWSPSVDSKIAG